MVLSCVEIVRTDQDYCFPKSVGYHPARIMEQIDGKSYSSASVTTADGLTHAMILHPIACGLAFIAFFTSFGTGVIGSILAAMIAAVAWLITLIVMAIDFALFGVCLIGRHIPMNQSIHQPYLRFPTDKSCAAILQIVKDHVNKDGSGSHAYFSVGMWTCLAAMVLLFFGMFIVLFTCFGARKRRRGTVKGSRDIGHQTGDATRTRKQGYFGHF